MLRPAHVLCYTCLIKRYAKDQKLYLARYLQQDLLYLSGKLLAVE